MITHYEDFEVIITNYGDQLQAQLGAAPGGRNLAHPIPITLPDDHIGWAEAKQGRKPEADLAELGHQLFKSLITGELADNWNACLGEMRQQPGTGLRLRFSHEAEVLNEVPLELLCTRTNPNREFLALDMRTPVVRSPRSGNPVQKRSVTLPLRMLVVIANPRLQVQTDSAAEQASLEEALHSLLQAKKLQVDYLGLESRSNTDYLTLQRILAQARPPYDVVHFIGHGALPDAHDEECEGALLFVDPQTDRRQDVRASDLVGILAGNGVRVAVLQACDGACPGTHNAFQGVAQRLIAGGLPAAVAMQCKVDKDVATCFCGQLYRYWLTESGLPLERAVTEARQALRQQFPGRASAWWTPVLFIRLESIEVLKVSLNEPPATEAPEKVRTWDIQTYLDDLTQVPEYARWADQPYVRKEDEDHYIQTQSKILPLFASPFDEDVGRRREDLLDVIHASDRLLILGEPGVGKTAALERIMWETANANGPVIPIYVPLSYYEGDLIAEVWGALEVTGVLHLSSRADVGEFLRQNQCLVLFDGLNEVRGDQRQQIAREIAEFVRAYRRHRYVITSRSQDQLWRTLREGNVPWNAVVIQRITDGQVREYLIAHLGSRQGKETHDSLNKPLHAMSQTPLFLWMLKEVRVRGGELPGNRGELFDQYVEKAVFTRDEGKLEISIPRSAKRQALAHLASSLQGEHRLTCREEEAVAIVSGKEQEYDPRSLIHEAQIHGLLKRVERKGEQQICFMHQSVQEYFVALTLRDIVASEVDNPAWQQLGRQVLRLGLAARASDPWWAESFVQLAGLTEYPSWLARAVAKVSPWLAFWCMIEGREIDEETRSVVETGTVDLLRSHDVKERQKAVRELEILENPRTAEYLVTVLGDEAEEVVNAAVRGLGKLGEPAAEYLHPHLERNTRARRAAIRALGLIWEIHPLTDLGGDNANLRLTALKALGQLGDTRVIEAVIAVARWDTDMTVRRRAVELLGQLGDPQSVGLLTAVLEDAEPSLRASAAIALGHIRDKRAVEPLTEALKDDHEVVRRRAIRALGKIWGLSQLERLSDDQVVVRLNAVAVLGQLADPRVVQPLIAALKDKGGAVCAGAAKALGQLGDTRALTPLISVLLTRGEPAARKAAAEALGKLGDRQAVEPLIAALRDQEREVQRSAAAALGLLRDKRAVEHLIAMCGDRRLRESAAKALAEIGRLAIPSLIASLQNEEEDVRASAAIALGQIGGAQALEALLLARKDDDVKVRTNVAAALGQIGGTQALEALVATLREDRDSIVRAYAATSLGQIGGEQASEALTAILEDEDEDETVWQMAIGALGRMWSLPQLVRLSDEDAVVRQDAAAALGQLGDKRAIKPLLATLRDPDEAVRHQSISALGQTWDLPQLVRLGDHDAKRRQDAAMSLGQLGDIRAVESLIATLRDSNAMARAAAAQALGQLDNARAVQPLIEALDDDDQSVQQAVARSLQQLAPKAMDQLIDALRTSRYWFRRQKVAETIGRIGEQGPLADALSHEDRHVRRQAAEDLARLGGGQAVEPLADALIRDEDSYVRRKAAEALGKSGNINAVWPLIQALLDDEDWLVRWVAAEAMGSIGHSSAVKSLITALKDDEWPVRWMAAKALGKIGDKSAVGPLIEALKDNWPTMWAVAETLGQLEDDRAVEPLVAALWDSDSDKYLRQAAVEALARIGAAIQGPLIEVLREGDEEARQRAIAALGQMEGPRDLTPLIEALSSGPSYEVWQGAMDALVQIGEPAVEPLIAVLQGGDWMARRRVARTLGQIGNTQAVRPLIEALGDSIRAVRQAAAEALHHVDSPQARAALRKYRQEFPEDLTSDEE